MNDMNTQTPMEEMIERLKEEEIARQNKADLDDDSPKQAGHEKIIELLKHFNHK